MINKFKDNLKNVLKSSMKHGESPKTEEKQDLATVSINEENTETPKDIESDGNVSTVEEKKPENMLEARLNKFGKTYKPTVYTKASYKNVEKVSEIPVEKYYLKDLLLQAIKPFGNNIVSRGIRLEIEELDISIETNKEVFLFILQEIVSNSLNHIIEGSIKIYMLEEKYLVVEDTGCGIPKDELPYIFEEGFVTSNSLVAESTEGIGLYKCAIALEKMEYPYEIQSILGIGTGFAIEIL